VGAESTLAQAARVDEAGQNSKLLPIIRTLREARIPVSVETYQPAVTRAFTTGSPNSSTTRPEIAAPRLRRIARRLSNRCWTHVSDRIGSGPGRQSFNRSMSAPIKCEPPVPQEGRAFEVPLLQFAWASSLTPKPNT